jgi:NlpC/P60 family
MSARRVSLCIGWMIAGLIGTGCASRGAVPRPFPTPRGEEPPAPIEVPVPLPNVAAATLLQTAMALQGAPYRMGGADPSGFDCSGFVQYVFWQHGVALPRTVTALAGTGEQAKVLEAGDLVFFAIDHASISHVGIALGSGRFVHAPSSRGVVRIESLTAPYWATRYRTARRVLTTTRHTRGAALQLRRSLTTKVVRGAGSAEGPRRPDLASSSKSGGFATTRDPAGAGGVKGAKLDVRFRVHTRL